MKDNKQCNSDREDRGSKSTLSIKVRIIFAILAILLLLLSFFYEKHKVVSLSNNDDSKELNGSEFNETTTFDGLMLKDENVYDINSLTPERLQERDCST